MEANLSEKHQNSVNTSVFGVPIELVFLTLPYRKIEEPVWKRQSKDYSLSITVGTNEKTNEYYGLPYGSYSRRILYHVCTEVIKTKKQTLQFGNTYSNAMSAMGFNNRSESVLRLFKDHFMRLFTSRFVLNYSRNDGGINKEGTGYLNLMKNVEFWGKGDKLTLNIRLTNDFYEYLMDSKIVPFSYEIIEQLTDSPVLMDIYIYLNYKAYTASQYKKDLFVSYEELFQNFGTINSIKSFKQSLKKHLKKLVEVHGGLALEETSRDFVDGILVSKFSKSSVGKQSELFSFSEHNKKLQEQVKSLAQENTNLKKATIEDPVLKRQAYLEMFREDNTSPFMCWYNIYNKHGQDLDYALAKLTDTGWKDYKHFYNCAKNYLAQW